jgi:ABC-type transport system involved in multi-copper enzyme maturation permease subunit
MTFLPIVERELRQGARRWATFWIRLAAAFFASAVASFVVLIAIAANPGSVGKAALGPLSWLALLFVLFEGLRTSCDSLSREKREGTLGLLFLTDLRGYDVVLGKFAASALTSFYALLAMVPALGIPVLLGGVTGGEFGRLVLALTNALFFTLAIGTLISAASRDERRAWTTSLLVVLIAFTLLPLLASIHSVSWVQHVTPMTAFLLFVEADYARNPALYWNAVWIPHLLAWVALATASFVLPRVWQETGRDRRQRRALSPAAALDVRERLLNRNPVAWLFARHTHQKVWLWSVVLLASLLGVIGMLWTIQASASPWPLFVFAVLFHLGLAVWVASEACHGIAEAQATGALDLLLTTPLTTRELIRGQHMALRHLFFRPIATLLVVELCLLLAMFGWNLARQEHVFASGALVFFGGLALLWFLLDLCAVAEAGMWFGLTSRNGTQAVAKTVGYVLLLPLLIAPCCVAITPGLMVAKSVIFFTWAQSKLERNFRRAAVERFHLSSSRSRSSDSPVR